MLGLKLIFILKSGPWFSVLSINPLDTALKKQNIVYIDAKYKSNQDI